MVDDFFDKSSRSSVIKRQIVVQYFQLWSKVILGARKQAGRDRTIAYVELFAGPGKYADGTVSTPIHVLSRAISRPDLRANLRTIFVDEKPDYCLALDAQVRALKKVELLSHVPRIEQRKVDVDILELIGSLKGLPTFYFVDPWGYKGLSAQLFGSMIRDWGSECLFLFNYDRINAGLANPSVAPLLDELFGAERAQRLRCELAGLDPHERAGLVVQEMGAALRDAGAAFVLPFFFKRRGVNRVSHHLVFVTKNEKANGIMKSVMAKMSTPMASGVAEYGFDPNVEAQLPLFDESEIVADVGRELHECCAGKTATVAGIYTEFARKTYLEKHCRAALLNLESAGLVVISDPNHRRREGQLGKSLVVCFPPKGESDTLHG